MTATKKELKQKENLEKLNNATTTLEALTKNINIQRNIRNMIREVLMILRMKKEVVFQLERQMLSAC